MSTTTTRRGFVKGAALGAAAIAGIGAVSAAGAEEAAETSADPNPGEGALQDRVDTYTHATQERYPGDMKFVLEGEELDAAMQFLADSSHYLYVNRVTPYYENYTLFPVTGFDTEWRSPLNGRNYRGPEYDPISRSTLWATCNPNGGINISIGSYWGCIPPNTELELNYHELEGYEPSDNWTIVCYMGAYQSVENFIREGRGSMLIDASLASHYGLPYGWMDRNVLDLELNLRKYVRRQITPQEYYDGLAPTTISWHLADAWVACDGWGPDAGENQYRSIPQFWGCATGDDAALNLTTDEEREAYIARAEADEHLMEELGKLFCYLYFDVMQVIDVVQDLGMDFEQDENKINGLDMDHDGLLDRYDDGELILSNAFGVEEMRPLPEWAYDLDFNQPWWISMDENFATILINPEGKRIIGAEEDGTPIVES